MQSAVCVQARSDTVRNSVDAHEYHRLTERVELNWWISVDTSVHLLLLLFLMTFVDPYSRPLIFPYSWSLETPLLKAPYRALRMASHRPLIKTRYTLLLKTPYRPFIDPW